MRYCLTVFLLLLLVTGAKGQTRYFEFRVECGHGNWQDTSFIAAASDQALISEARAELAKAPEQRRFINGRIAYGNGDHNYNGPHSFLWHFIPNEWSFAENAVELCDGCPYSDLDANTAYWVDTVRYFCSWSAKPVREVFGPTGVEEKAPSFEAAFRYDQLRGKLFPGPELADAVIRIHSLYGEELGRFSGSGEIDVSRLSRGLYLVRFESGRSIGTYSFILY